jgi:UDP-N-acetyl-D-mannosaminuronic acid dehydrogenase
MIKNSEFIYDAGLIGGGGHVGLPLALLLADTGLSTVIFDTNAERIEQIRSGVMPFQEEGAESMLPAVLANGTLLLSETAEILAQCRTLILIIGTPVDEHLNPLYSAVIKTIRQIEPYLRKGQLLILRSTLFPGMTSYINRYLQKSGFEIPVAFCPERVAQGYSIKEFRTLPQLVSGCNADALHRAKEFFQQISTEILELEPEEAEFAKLITNSWRYLQFASVNQFYMLAAENGLDFFKIYNACKHNYPRLDGMPHPGFAAGPCLVKDTMQLAAYSRNTFHLGHAGMLVNEGLPYHLVSQLCLRLEREHRLPLCELTAAILGMSFKGGSDDRRDSLSYKLKKLLQIYAGSVLCSDPFVRDDPELTGQEKAVEAADVIFIGAPHPQYKNLQIPKDKLIVDVWEILPKQN